MPPAQTFHTIANAFTAIDIAEPIMMSAETSAGALDIWAELTLGSWFCMVRNKGRIVGYLTPEDQFENLEGTESAVDLANPITPDQIVPASIPVVRLLSLFEQHFFFFVLDGNDLTHVVCFLDVDKLPVKVCLFSLFMELEYLMLQRLIPDGSAPDELISCLPESRLEKARSLCALKYRDETSERLLLCTTFIDKANIFLRDQYLRQLLPFQTKKEGERFFDTVERIRNQLAHSDSILTVIKEPAELSKFLANIEKAIAALSVEDTRTGCYDSELPQ